MEIRPVIELRGLPQRFPGHTSALLKTVAEACIRNGGGSPLVFPMKQIKYGELGDQVDVKVDGVKEHMDFDANDLASAIKLVVYNEMFNFMASEGRPMSLVQVRCFNDLGTLIGSATSEEDEEVARDLFTKAA